MPPVHYGPNFLSYTRRTGPLFPASIRSALSNVLQFKNALEEIGLNCTKRARKQIVKS